MFGHYLETFLNSGCRVENATYFPHSDRCYKLYTDYNDSYRYTADWDSFASTVNLTDLNQTYRNSDYFPDKTIHEYVKNTYSVNITIDYSQSAQRICASNLAGYGILASIPDEETNQFLSNLIPRDNWTFTGGQYFNGDNTYTDIVETNYSKWEDRTGVKRYNNWENSPGWDNNAGFNVVVRSRRLLLNKDGSWKIDKDLERSALPFICETPTTGK